MSPLEAEVAWLHAVREADRLGALTASLKVEHEQVSFAYGEAYKAELVARKVYLETLIAADRARQADK